MPSQNPSTPNSDRLSRQLGVPSAVIMGLGSIVGTGVFVSIGIAAGVTGPSVILAIAVAAVVATLNGLSSAQLAANHPVSGGTYEYGYRWLTPSLGFTAGWMFLCAKSASAATAAIGFSGYLLHAAGLANTADNHHLLVSGVALTAVLVMTVLVITGLRRSNAVNIAIVSITLIALLLLVLAGLPQAISGAGEQLRPFFQPAEGRLPATAFLEACALMFVAFTGYGRIATLGEEVVQPRRTIPIAIIVTLVVSSLLYMSVGFVAVAVVGSQVLSAATLSAAAPLEIVATNYQPESLGSIVRGIVSIGAITAMLGVLLNLILGLSRVVFAMGSRGDLPKLFGEAKSGSVPAVAIVLVGAIIGGLALIGDVKTTWSFSAFTVLVYYTLTNLAATRLSASERLYPSILAWLGVFACLSLAFWVQPMIWMVGVGLIALGLLLQQVMRRLTSGKA